EVLFTVHRLTIVVLTQDYGLSMSDSAVNLDNGKALLAIDSREFGHLLLRVDRRSRRQRGFDEGIEICGEYCGAANILKKVVSSRRCDLRLKTELVEKVGEVSGAKSLLQIRCRAKKVLLSNQASNL